MIREKYHQVIYHLDNKFLTPFGCLVINQRISTSDLFFFLLVLHWNQQRKKKINKTSAKQQQFVPYHC